MGCSIMPATVTIITPENVELTYELAGIGTRFLAALVDMLLHGLIFLLFTLAILALYFAGLRVPEWLEPWAVGGTILFLFGLFWGYSIVFETRWSGQTPGKRLMQIRVIKDGGYPIDFRAAVIRNLMRYVDYLPFGYAVGAMAIFFSRDYKRLGDFVAGTIVVSERLVRTPQRLLLPETPAAPSEPPPFAVSRVTHTDYLAVRHYLDRRDALPPPTRDRLAARIAQPLMTRLGWHDSGSDVQAFLESVAQWYERTHGT
jgi:uncharacterized RDD family membrane protein YckC